MIYQISSVKAIITHYMICYGPQEGHVSSKKLSGEMHGYLSAARCRLADAQLMPLPLTISCSSKCRLVSPF